MKQLYYSDYYCEVYMNVITIMQKLQYMILKLILDNEL